MDKRDDKTPIYPSRAGLLALKLGQLERRVKWIEAAILVITLLQLSVLGLLVRMFAELKYGR